MDDVLAADGAISRVATTKRIVTPDIVMRSGAASAIEVRQDRVPLRPGEGNTPVPRKGVKSAPCIYHLTPPFDNSPFFQQSGNMKTTIELPDQLMTEVKVLAAREQRKLGELMAELVRAGLEGRTRPVSHAGQQAGAEQWLVEWLRLADEIMQDAPAAPQGPPTARALLEEERNRLEHR